MRMRLQILGSLLVLSAATAACGTATYPAFSTRTAEPVATQMASTAFATAPPAASQVATGAPASMGTPTPAERTPATSFCADQKAVALITQLRSALLTSDGPLLATLVSPVHRMDTRLFRDGRVVNYDREHAQFLFQSSFAADWGLAPASGLPTRGSFHELVLPALLDVFRTDYTLTCDQIQTGGATYRAAWPYAGVEYYSAYFAGTPANGNLDWRTWALGMQYVDSKPFLYAVMQFQWEP